MSMAAQRVKIQEEDKAWGIKKYQKKKILKYKNKILKREGQHSCTLQLSVVFTGDRVTNSEKAEME